MSRNSEIKEGAISLKRGLDLVEFLLEGAEIEYLNIETEEGSTIELTSGITFLFDDRNELVDIYNN